MSDVSVNPSGSEGRGEDLIGSPGSIQPHGYLFVLNQENLTIAAASENVAEAIGVGPMDLVGKSITDLLVTTTKEDLRSALRSEIGGAPLHVRFRRSPGAQEWDGVVHQRQGLVLLELVPLLDFEQAETLLEEVRYAIERIRRSDTPRNACARLAEEMRQLTGFGRVFIFRFDADWNGEVIAENKSEDMISHQGNFYPASDFPERARALYTHDNFRLIPDTGHTPSPIIPAVLPSNGRPVDLSGTKLRSVWPIYLQYFIDMGVAASLSVPIVRDGKLWGLAACHHPVPRVLPKSIVQACELFTQATASYLDAQDLAAAVACFETVRRLEAALATQMSGDDEDRIRLEPIVPVLLDLTRSQGLAICEDGKLWTAGQVPPTEQILALIRWLPSCDAESFTTSRLSDRFPQAESDTAIASGIAARRLPGGWLIWFREQWSHALTWGEEPHKASPAQRRNGPAKSTAAEFKSRRAQSRPWMAQDLLAVDEIMRLVLRRVAANQMRRLTESERALRLYRDRTATELEAARRMQMTLLPSQNLQQNIAAKSGLDIASHVGTSSELSGDFWGILDLGQGCVGVYIIDVVGHGTAAALMTYRLHTLIHELRGTVLREPARLLKTLNMCLCDHTAPGEFATMFYAIVDPNGDRIAYAAAGAPPPIIRGGKDLPPKLLDSSGVPIGITADADYRSSETAFGPGAMLFLYSDMLTAALDEPGHRAREADVFERVRRCAMTSSAAAVVEHAGAPFLDPRANPLSDDLTIVCLKRRAP